MPAFQAGARVWEAPEIYQFSYGREKADSYLIIRSGRAVLVDAASPELAERIRASGLALDLILLTHEHCDHLWGLNAVRAAFPAARTICARACSEAMGDPARNQARRYHIYMALRYGSACQEKGEADGKWDPELRCQPADQVFETRTALSWQGLALNLIPAPGHSPGSGGSDSRSV